MPYKYYCLLYISPMVFLLDQVTKWIVREQIPRGNAVAIIPGYVDLVHVMNTGAAFGFMAGPYAGWRTPFFLGIAAIALIGLLWIMRRCPAQERLLPLIFSLVIGGILGNGLDRLRLGAVVDFISCHWRDATVDLTAGGWRLAFPLEWPAFNVADSAITVSMVLLSWQLLRKR
ncbi:MAG: signal peptidase II [Deltaproteobacteria bacterium]|nr:signal peptidase II [Deltaproteobacteria bacterium]